MTEKNDSLNQAAKALIVQKHQINSGQIKLGELNDVMDAMDSEQSRNQEMLDTLLVQAQVILSENEIVFEVDEEDAFLIEESLYVSESEIEIKHQPIAMLDYVEAAESTGWEEYVNSIEAYAVRRDINFGKDPFQNLMSSSQRIVLEKRIKEEFSLKGAHCDRYDYMIAATCGLLGGLIDACFVGSPSESHLTKFADDLTDEAVQTFAKFNGWQGAADGKDPTASAIGFLERKFKINYDHPHGGAVGGLFKMSTKNHHIKSLGHSPDLVGLFFSILDQFSSTAHFIDSGRIISVDTTNKKFKLSGSNFAAKLFAGFVNWLGHLFSDVAGSSNASGRGSGIPIPFYSLLQFINIGEFGQHRQTFAKIAVQVFEKGYDFRHGMVLAVPVLVAELFTKIMWVVKGYCYHKRTWRECVPSADNPELRRMLLVANGSLCLVDATDATLRSGGNIIPFMLRSNIIAWTRFGTFALKELNAEINKGRLDNEAIDQYLDAECARLCR